MPSFTKGGAVQTPFGKNVYFRSTKGLKFESFTLAKNVWPATTIDNVPGQKVAQPGTVLAKITAGPDTGKVGPYQASGGNGTAEIQTLTPTTVTAGTFTLAFGTATTAPIVWNASAATIQAALESLSTVGLNVICAGGPINSTPVTVTFYGALAGNVALLTVNNTGLTGTIAATETTAGVAGAADGRQTATNICGILDTFLPWQLMERDVEIAALYEGTVVQAWCYELTNAGLFIPLSNTTADGVTSSVPNFRSKRLDIKFS